MNENEFMRQQQAAVERMREMQRQAQGHKFPQHKMPPVPSFVKMPENERSAQARSYGENNNQPRRKSENTSPPIIRNNNTGSAQPATSLPPSRPNNRLPFLDGLNIPFLDRLTQDGDTTLILGLLLILMSENCDKTLLFALVYILL